MKSISIPLLIASFLGCISLPAAETSAPAAQPRITLDLSKPGAPVSPMLYGLMTEEINHSYDGGLYAELIKNRSFKDDPQIPLSWSVTPDGGGSIALDEDHPINGALTTCLRLEAGNTGRAGIVNEGFWGIPVQPATTYRASFYAKAKGAEGPLTVSIESNDGSKTYATAEVPKVGGEWKRYTVTLTTAKDAPASTANRFVISTAGPGTYWFNLVSLFPPTWHDRPNGNRVDLMQMLDDMNAKFLRLPGGNYLEGDRIEERFPWKRTLGGIENRPGHPGCWNYRSSDGMGLLEFLEWCEDLKIEPVLAVYAGYSLRGAHIEPGPDLQPFVDEALEEIEYVTGGTDTKWGAQRAKDGHPEPFKLTYVEIGNEDQFDKSHSYDGRFTQFYNAIKKKYPNLQLIATTPDVKSCAPDVIDDHFYRNAWQMQDDATHYDKTSRTGPKIFVGEWATREGEPTTNFNAALGDAAWMTGMERNSDVVVMSCYAPLFVNVNPGGMQWKSNLIGYDALTSYGSPSYYAQKMFNHYLGNEVVAATSKDIPTQPWQQPAPKDKPAPPPKQVPTLFYSATRDTKTGTIYLKVVNTAGTPQSVDIEVNGAEKVLPEGESVVLTSKDPGDTNSLAEPAKVAPVTSKINDLSAGFTHSFAPHSINVLKIETR